MAPTTRKLLSIVTPCYNEEANVEDCYRTVARIVAESLPEYDHEHVFADNASSDGTVELLRRLAREDERVKVILNARNYGPFRSTFNALLRTSGDAVVVLLAADLQDPPELIVDFTRHWEQGHEIVYGIRANRQEGILLRIARSAKDEHAVFELLRRKDPSTVPWLREMLLDAGENGAFRINAAFALGTIGGVEARAALEEALAGQLPPQVKEAVEHVLGHPPGDNQPPQEP